MTEDIEALQRAAYRLKIAILEVFRPILDPTVMWLQRRLGDNDNQPDS